ncbi:MAG TPA: hypothetical protein VGN16_17430 [Acidobacteriaceae bacterium]|jgi:hypothetical protein
MRKNSRVSLDIANEEKDASFAMPQYLDDKASRGSINAGFGGKTAFLVDRV